MFLKAKTGNHTSVYLWRLDKNTMVYSHCGILYSSENKQTTSIFLTMDGSQKYNVKWKVAED